jgi:integrase
MAREGKASGSSVRHINQDILRRAFSEPRSDRYYIREQGGRDSINGLCLRVGARVVWFGHRKGGGWTPVVQARPEMTPAEIDDARRQVQAALAEGPQPTSALPRQKRLTVEQLGSLYLADLEANRGSKRSDRTLVGYRDLWRVHLKPLIGHLRIDQVTPDVVREQVKLAVPQSVQERLNRRGLSPESATQAAKQGGRVTANRALQQGEAAFSFAVRMEWLTRNPFSEHLVARYDEEPDQHCLSASDYAALGEALREAEAALLRPRPLLPMRSLAALRVLLLTPARPGEVLPAVISPEHRLDPLGRERHFCDLDSRYPAIWVPRAKGDRGSMKRPSGRFVFLPLSAVQAIRQVPRLDGSIYAFPGDLPDAPICRLEKAWSSILRIAGLSHIPLKTTRPSWRTHAVDAGIPPEHVQGLMGHAGLKITDTVYLKRITPSLWSSAETTGHYLSGLLGEWSCPGFVDTSPLEKIGVVERSP